jgi:hypothetical protein
VFPAQTAYRERLYETSGVAPAQAQRIEQNFLRPLDTLAATALERIAHGPARIALDDQLRRSWAKFISSILMRSPDDISILKTAVTESWNRAMPDLKKNYGKLRESADPLRFENFIDHHALDLFQASVDYDPIAEIITKMIWVVRRIDVKDELLTSDRPILMSATLSESMAYLTMPIGPKMLFAALIDEETRSFFVRRDLAELVTVVNRLVTAHAVKYVYGRKKA